MQVQRDPIIQPEIFVINGPVVHQADAKGDNTAIDSPYKKTSTLRHYPPESREISFTKFFELHRRTLVYRQIKWINLVQQRRNIVNNLKLNVGRTLRFAKFPPQAFSRAVAQVTEVVIEISEVKAEPRHRHARDSDKTIARKEGEGLAVSRRKIL